MKCSTSTIIVSIVLGLGSACVLPGDGPVGTEEELAFSDSEAEKPGDLAEFGNDEDADASIEAANELGQKPDPQGGGLVCGDFCVVGIPVGFGCSTGCAGICPNAVVCGIPQADAEIWASPTTVEVAPGTLGSTEICWKTQGIVKPVWIRVRVDNGPGQTFTKESDNTTECEDAPWIQAGHSYKFSIHTENSDASYSYDSVIVNGVAGPPASGEDDGDDGFESCGGCEAGWDCHCFDQCWPSGLACP